MPPPARPTLDRFQSVDPIIDKFAYFTPFHYASNSQLVHSVQPTLLVRCSDPKRTVYKSLTFK